MPCRTLIARVCALGLTLLVAGCGVLPGSGAAPTSTPSTAPATTASPSPTAARAAASAVPSPSTVPASPTTAGAPRANTVYVGNTDGEGVYVRNTPAMADRARAYPDGTALTIIGDDVDGDGQHWKHIRTPDGLEGFVPAMYTTDVQP